MPTGTRRPPPSTSGLTAPELKALHDVLNRRLVSEPLLARLASLKLIERIADGWAPSSDGMICMMFARAR